MEPNTVIKSYLNQIIIIAHLSRGTHYQLRVGPTFGRDEGIGTLHKGLKVSPRRITIGTFKNADHVGYFEGHAHIVG